MTNSFIQKNKEIKEKLKSMSGFQIYVHTDMQHIPLYVSSDHEGDYSEEQNYKLGNYKLPFAANSWKEGWPWGQVGKKPVGNMVILHKSCVKNKLSLCLLQNILHPKCLLT